MWIKTNAVCDHKSRDCRVAVVSVGCMIVVEGDKIYVAAVVSMGEQAGQKQCKSTCGAKKHKEAHSIFVNRWRQGEKRACAVAKLRGILPKEAIVSCRLVHKKEGRHVI